MATASLVGGSFLSAFLQVLFDRMASREVLDFFKRRALNVGLLKNLNAAMIAVNGLLDDAEERQIRKEAVRLWLDELKDAIFEADDLLDVMGYEALRLEIEGGAQKGQLQNFLSSFNPLTERKKGEMEGKLELILERLEFLVKQKDTLGLIVDIGEKPSSQKTTSMVDESGVYGRDDDKEAIMKLLLSDDAKGNKWGVIAIVGMCGIGKTTLAQLVYNDSRVQEWFDLKAWVCVSQESDVFKVIKDILKELGSVASDTKTPNQLQLDLKDRVKGKSMLLILDDVWNIKEADWDVLQRPLKYGEKGSKIIVTTRQVGVTSVMRTVSAHHLKELTDDACWFLFRKHAFDDGDFGAHPDYELIGRKIVRKCKGLPLAAKALGSLLYSKKDVGKWEKILESNIWNLSSDNILPALRLSYYYLPSHLKQCFAYCAIFPKDYKFRKEELVLLWMAEGFLVQPKGNNELEEVGDEYFQDLVQRSFFQQSCGDPSYFCMHDLINDLAKFVSREFCFRFEGNYLCNIGKRTRHFSYATEYDACKKFQPIYEAQFLRTFLQLSQRQWCKGIDEEVINDLLPIFKHLRVLSLYLDHSIIELPDSIGRLKHLRYLNLSKASIKKLPEIVSTLYNLQTIIVQGCHGLVKLPTNMGRLINLIHLDIGGTKLQEMPLQIGKLTKLHKLTDFILGRQSGSNIKELGKLVHLKETLCIWNLQNVVDAQDALEANMNGKKHLMELELRWDGDTVDSQHERDILEHLQPHTNMERLSIVGYGGTRFPKWLGDSSFSNMVFLQLSGCKYCSSLPPLGQLASLKYLSIVAFDELMVIDSEFYGSCMSLKKPFGSLEILRLENLLQLHEWISYESGAFPLLRELYIKQCPNLTKAMSNHLPSLTTFEIEGCQQLVSALPRVPTICRLINKDNFGDVLLEKFPSGPHSLKVNGFHSVDFLLKGMEQVGCFTSTLDKIEIKNSDSVKLFPLELFPKAKHFVISRCPNLESHCADERPAEGFTSLRSLEIEKCPMLTAFPKGGLPAPNLTQLRLVHCTNLEFLPEFMHSLLPSLVFLEISYCPKLASFPEGGLPSKLESLKIWHCDKLVAGRMQWDLQVLCSLSHFTIGLSAEVKSFPEMTLLPYNLKSLAIWNLQNLEYLDYQGLQHLTCLRELSLSDCPKLQSIPEEGLPSSLSSLFIFKCLFLRQRCEREKGEDWAKISHIPFIQLL